jgi:hypothetical protein
MAYFKNRKYERRGSRKPYKSMIVIKETYKQ